MYRLMHGHGHTMRNGAHVCTFCAHQREWCYCLRATVRSRQKVSILYIICIIINCQGRNISAHHHTHTHWDINDYVHACARNITAGAHQHNAEVERKLVRKHMLGKCFSTSSQRSASSNVSTLTINNFVFACSNRNFCFALKVFKVCCVCVV